MLLSPILNNVKLFNKSYLVKLKILTFSFIYIRNGLLLAKSKIENFIEGEMHIIILLETET